MTILFKNPMHDEFGGWAFGYMGTGGPEFGEVRAVAEAVGDGDDSAYNAAFTAAGDRLAAEADAALARGHRQSAREAYLKAAAHYTLSLHPLYGAPVDPRFLAAFRKQVAAFDAGLSLGMPAVKPVTIPFDGHALPAYLIPAEGHESETRPLIILNGGYDSTMVDSYFASAVAASRRGYHALLFDGPGQGAMLYEQNVPLRPDWENVIRAVVDFALTQPIVDAQRIALYGWSLGGHLAPRAASAEPRLAALIADPATWGIAEGFRGMAIRLFGVPAAQAADLGKLDQSVIDRLDAAIRGNPQLHWKVVQRGFWVHGVDNLRDYLASAELFTLNGRVEKIACPTLVIAAEGDALGADAARFFDALTCPKDRMTFTAAEGADGHCEMQNRAALNRRVLDWLDDRFG